MTSRIPDENHVQTDNPAAAGGGNKASHPAAMEDGPMDDNYTPEELRDKALQIPTATLPG